MSDPKWADWSVKDHIDEAQRLVTHTTLDPKISGSWDTVALALAQIHATLALTKAQMGQTTRGY
jgi:hypothetical protein